MKRLDLESYKMTLLFIVLVDKAHRDVVSTAKIMIGSDTKFYIVSYYFLRR